MKYPAVLLLFLALVAGLFCPPNLAAQTSFEVLKDAKKIEIPFEYQNNLLVVSVLYERIFPLKFIFDTGAEHTILAKKEIADMFGVRYEREFKLLGTDMKTELLAYLVRGIHLKVGNLVLPNHSMLVLGDDYLHLDQITGEEIHGILGADAFRGVVLKINYERKIITLQRASTFKSPGDDYEQISIDVHRNKVYLKANLQIQQDTPFNVKLLLDTGASPSLLMNTNTHPDLHMPENTLKGNIGAGLGGFLEGYLGRVNHLQIGAWRLNEVLTNFQELPPEADTSLLHGRHGIIGNQVLSRFHIIIDYPREKLYLQPNKRFKEKFEFDKSGLVVVATGEHLNSFIVHDVLPGSPAAEAGLKEGDKVVRLNWTSAGFLSLEDINHKLRQKEGKKITLVVRRGAERLKLQFQLRRLI